MVTYLNISYDDPDLFYVHTDKSILSQYMFCPFFRNREGFRNYLSFFPSCILAAMPRCFYFMEKYNVW